MTDKKKPIIGSKGDKQRPPNEAPNSLRSIAYARVVDLVSEGEIIGLVDGLKSIYLNETPIENPDGSKNFNNYTVEYRYGTQTQDYIKGFDAVENELLVGVELTNTNSYTRQFTNLDLTALRVRLSVPALYKTNTENGDTNGHTVQYAIDISVDGGPFVQVLGSSFSGKTTSKYERSHRIELPEATTGWQLRVRRLTTNSSSAMIADDTYVEAVTEIIDGKLRYPNSAIFALTFDAEQFQSIPSRSYDIKGRIIRVPANYDPETRTYDGIWDGTFKLAWTDNPAWCFYDIVTHERYGLGHLLSDLNINKWSLYTIGQYCDELVPDGKGGMEPRFTCNLYLQSRADAYRVLQDMTSIFRGMAYWANGEIITVGDMPRDVQTIYAPANVVNGSFEYQSSARKQRYTVALVSWSDINDFGRAKVEYVDDQEGIAKYGIQQTEVTAIGCSSQSMAQRLGRYLLATSRYETNTVSFSVGLEGTIVPPGSIIGIVDPMRAQARMGGRITAINAPTNNIVTVDSMPETEIEIGDTLTVMMPDGVAAERTVSAVNTSTKAITVSIAFPDTPVAGAVWMVEKASVQAQKFRVVSVADNGDATFTITALQYEEDKFDAADYTASIDPDPITLPDPLKASVQAPPTNVVATAAEVAGQVVAMTKVELSWDQAPGAVSYQAEYRIEGDNWVRLPVTTAQTITISNILAGSFIARVTAIAPNGVHSQYAYCEPLSVVDQTTPPGFVADLEEADQSNANAIAQEIIDRGAAITAEAAARADAIQDAADAAALDATNKANAAKNAAIAAAASYTDDEVLAEANARADALIAERNAWEAAVETEQLTRQTEDESLAVAISLVSAGSGEQFDSKKIWYFDSDLESWTGNGAPTIVDGWLRPADHASNPYIQSPDALNIAGESYRFVKVRIKKVGNPVWKGQLWWQTDADPTFTAGKSIAIPEPSFDANGVSAVVWQDIPWWPNTIKRVQLRLSTSQDASNYFLVDWIAIGRPTPGAGVSLVQEETAARIAADSAEASQRNTLAVQLRGSYTGTSLSGVASGLIYDEREARVSADASQVSRISTMEARMPTGSGQLATSASVTSEANARASADTAISNRVGIIEARVPTGTDMLANEARVVSAENAAASATQAVAQDLDAVEARMPSGTGKVATEASVTAESTARVNADNALGSRVTVVEARMPAGSGTLATEASVTSEASARASGDTANANRITAMEVSLGAGGNLIPNADLAIYSANGISGWNVAAAGSPVLLGGPNVAWLPTGMVGANMHTTTGSPLSGSEYMDSRPTAGLPVEPGKNYMASVYIGAHRCQAQIFVLFSDAAGNSLGGMSLGNRTGTGLVGGTKLSDFDRLYAYGVAPANAHMAQLWIRGAANGSTGEDSYVFWLRPMFAEIPATVTQPGPWEPSAAGAGSTLRTQGLAIDANTLAISQQDDFIQGVADDLETLDLQIQSPTTGLNARAKQTDFSTLKNRVDTVGGSIETMASNISSVQASVATKADASAFNALDAQVNNATTGLATKASSSALTAVKASLSGGNNQIPNSTFNDGLSGLVGTSAGDFSALVVNTHGTNYRPPNVNTIGRSNTSGATIAPATYQDAFWTIPVVEPGKKYIFSAYVGGHRSRAQLFLMFIDAAGNPITPSASSSLFDSNVYGNVPPATCTLANFVRLNAAGVAPANAVSARAYWRVMGNNLANPFGWLCRPLFEEVGSEQNSPSNWSEGAGDKASAAVTNLLRTDIDDITGRVEATWALKLDANDKVSSIVAMNDGTESNIVFDFDRVSFLASNGGSYISGDTIEQRANGYLYVTGAGFGANSDLVMWYGMDRDPDTCTKANAIAYADTTGKFYVQEIQVGDIEFNANSNSTATPQTLQMVNNNTNGGSKVITAGYSFWGFKYSSGSTLPIPSGSATLSLWRKVGGGSFVQLGSTVNVTFTGTREIDPNGGSTAELRGEGSITFTDTDTSMSDHTYEWRLTSRTNSIPPNSQAMSLKSVE